MERIKQVREAVGLTQDKFAEQIGLSRVTISQYEINHRIPSNQVILAICREFNINEDWLRNGTGEMFIKQSTITLDEYARQRNMTQFEREAFLTYLSVDPDIRDEFANKFKNFVINFVIAERKAQKARRAALEQKPQPKRPIERAAHYDGEGWDEEAAAADEAMVDAAFDED